MLESQTSTTNVVERLRVLRFHVIKVVRVITDIVADRSQRILQLVRGLLITLHQVVKRDLRRALPISTDPINRALENPSPVEKTEQLCPNDKRSRHCAVVISSLSLSLDCA